MEPILSDQQLMQGVYQTVDGEVSSLLQVFADRAETVRVPLEDYFFSSEALKRYEEEPIIYPISFFTRLTRALTLYKGGFGRKRWIDVRIPFGDYLSLVPPIPEEYIPHDERFPDLILVDARIELEDMRKSVGYTCHSNHCSLEDFDGTRRAWRDDASHVYWMRCQDGRKNLGKSVQTCRKEFAEDERGLNAHEGISLSVQKSEIIKEYCIDLPGSVHTVARDRPARFGRWHDHHKGPWLDWIWDDYVHPKCGSASRRA